MGVADCSLRSAYAPSADIQSFTCARSVALMAWRLITVTQMLVTKWGDRLRCRRCGRKLEVGEEVWRHYITRKRSSRTDYCCKGCYKKLWF